jgi:hypothetical protein
MIPLRSRRRQEDGNSLPIAARAAFVSIVTWLGRVSANANDEDLDHYYVGAVV